MAYCKFIWQDEKKTNTTKSCNMSNRLYWGNIIQELDK